MEHLLLEVWQRRRGRTLTLEAYAASGGVEGALARRANSIYGAMSPERQAVARRVLLRLTQPGEGTEDTRRRATRAELITRPGEEDEVDAVVGALAEARLLTTGKDEATGEPVVDVTHEALIRGWPELRGWINDDREQLRLHRRLSDAATEWDAGGRDDGQLYRGAPLARLGGPRRVATSTSWSGGSSPRAASGLSGSARPGASGRGSLSARWRSALAIVAVLGDLAPSSPRQDATDQRDVAQSRQLATESRTAARQPTRSWRPCSRPRHTTRPRLPRPRPRCASRSTTPASGERSPSAPTAGPRPSSASGDGRLVVGDLRRGAPALGPGARSARRLGRDTGYAPRRTERRRGDRRRLPDRRRRRGRRRLVAVAGRPGPARRRRGRRARSTRLRVSPDGRRVLTAGDGGVFEHDLATGRRRTITSGFAEDAIYAGAAGGVFANDEDGSLLRFGPGDAGGRQVAVPGTVQSLGVSADGRMLAVGTAEGLVVLRLGGTPKIVFSSRFPAGITSVVVRPDGLIAASGGDGSVRVMDSSGAVVSRMTGHAGVATDVAFLGPDRVASTGDSTARVWAWRDGQEPRLAGRGAAGIDRRRGVPAGRPRGRGAGGRLSGRVDPARAPARRSCPPAPMPTSRRPCRPTAG